MRLWIVDKRGADERVLIIEICMYTPYSFFFFSHGHIRIGKVTFSAGCESYQKSLKMSFEMSMLYCYHYD